jgi:hypothetical protein
MNTINTCSSVQTLHEQFIVSVSTIGEDGFYNLLIEGEDRNSVQISGPKEDLTKIAFAITRAINNIK